MTIITRSISAARRGSCSFRCARELATSKTSEADRLNDLGAIFRLRSLIADTDRAAAPRMAFIAGGPCAGRIGFLAGSFNPLTLAHAKLARRAAQLADLATVCFVVGKTTIGKEHPSGAVLEDRLLALSLHAGVGRTAVLLCNRGLYVDQAIAARQAFPRAQELIFIVGYDKLLQILDPYFYRKRDAALEALFARAKLLVAARLGQEAEAVEALVERPENRPFRDRIAFLPFPRYLQGVSSSALCAALAKGIILRSRLPIAAVALIEATAAYLPPLRLASGEQIDRYKLRNALIEVVGPHGFSNPSVADWLAALWSDSALGAELRSLLKRKEKSGLIAALESSPHPSRPT